MNVLQALPSSYSVAPAAPQPDTSTVRACRTCHALFEPAASRQAGIVNATASPPPADERFCSKACRHAARRRGR